MVNLILEMAEYGHPAYACLDKGAVRRRAADLPEEGIPPEVWTVVQEAASTHDMLQPQKAATPCDGMETLETAGKIFASQRARAIVAEGESREDANARELAALKEMQDNLLSPAQKEAHAAVQSLEVRTGNKFLDQFRPEYFATAFPFCFKYGTACPDVVNTAKLPGQGLLFIMFQWPPNLNIRGKRYHDVCRIHEPPLFPNIDIRGPCRKRRRGRRDATTPAPSPSWQSQRPLR